MGIKENNKKVKIKIPFNHLWKAFFPLGATVIILLLTRIEAFGIKPILNATAPALELGNLSLSASGVLQAQNILGTELSWSHALLYVPSILPFFLVSVISFWVLGMHKMFIKKVFRQTHKRMKKPTLALIAALILVKLFLVGEGAPAFVLGQSLAGLFGTLWILFAPFLGALGAFFSGSNTIANLTFGGVQYSAAQNLNESPTTLLALHNIGGSAGNMISISNIIAGCSVLGILNQEGKILAKTIWPLVVYCLMGGILGMVFL